MRLPDISNTIRDEARDVTYCFMAYRIMTYAEMLLGVRQLHAQPSIRRQKKPIRRHSFIVLTLYGATTSI